MCAHLFHFAKDDSAFSLDFLLAQFRILGDVSDDINGAGEVLHEA